MRIQYTLTKDEVDNARRRLERLRKIALMNRDAGEDADNREFYLKAKGFEEALTILGIL